MAMQSFQLDPNAGGVSQAEFDAHTHNYRKITQIGIDQSKNWVGPTYADVLDDQEVHVTDGTDAEAIGVVVSTEATGVPN
jgi:hypothetical protein